MTSKQRKYSIFYLAVFILAVGTGLSQGFGGSHTPPLPFVIEFLCLPIGLILLIIDILNKKTPKTLLQFGIHIIGLAINGLVMLYTLAPLIF